MHFRQRRFGRRYGFWGSRFSTDTAPTINFHLPSSIPTSLSLSLSQKFEKHELCESEYMGPNLFDVQPSRQIQIPIFPNPPPSEKYTHFVRTSKTTTTHLVCLCLCGTHQVRQNQRQGLFRQDIESEASKTYMLQKANSVNQALNAPNRL